MTPIEITNLRKEFGELVAVNDFTMKIEGGEIFGLVGPNGAGKTTMMKMLVGLMKPASGAIKIMGMDFQQNPEECKAHMGYLPENPTLYEYLTAREFLDFIGRIKKVDEIEEKVGRLDDSLDLGEKMYDYIGTLSHGMRQKVAIMAALLNNPTILLLDEPLTGLDPKSQRGFKDILRKKCEEGCTILLSTHILDVAERLCTQVGVINHGKLLATGTLDGLRSISKSSDGASLEDVFIKLTME